MDVQGFAGGPFGPLRQYFAEILTAQPGAGAAFAARCDGRLDVDLRGGYADLGRRRRIRCRQRSRPPTHGTVQFRAMYVRQGQRGVIAETSRFVRHDRHWTYLGPID
jgi:YchJ, middle NTF2-like domain